MIDESDGFVQRGNKGRCIVDCKHDSLGFAEACVEERRPATRERVDFEKNQNIIMLIGNGQPPSLPQLLLIESTFL